MSPLLEFPAPVTRISERKLMSLRAPSRRNFYGNFYGQRKNLCMNLLQLNLPQYVLHYSHAVMLSKYVVIHKQIR